MSNTDTNQASVVYVTAPDLDTARRIASALIENQEAACVNIVPDLESVYRWEGKVENDAEILLIIKTRQGMMAAIDERLNQLHPDDVPERIALPIIDGAPAYMQWLIEQTRGTTSTSDSPA